MAKCKLCGKSGIFLSVDKDGYCKSCAEWRKKREQEELEAKLLKEQLEQKEQEKLAAIPVAPINTELESRKRKHSYPDPKFSNITPKGKYFDFVVFDTETTGLAPATDRIVELAAIRYRNGLPVEAFHTYINPGKEISKEASAINGITNADVADAPKIGDVIAAFDEFVGKDIVVAHNLEFDLKFTYYSGSNIIENGNKLVDTLDQAKRLLNKDEVYNYKLDTICDRFKITIAKQHSALADAYATGKVFLRLVSRQQDIPTEIWNSIKD